MNTIHVLINKETPTGIIWGDEYGTYTPDEMPVYMRSMFEVIKHKGDKEEHKTVYINNLRKFGLDVITILDILNYSEYTGPEKDMPSRSYNYLIGDNACVYYIYVKYSKRYTCKIVDIDNFTSISDPRVVLDTWHGDDTIQGYVKAYTGLIKDMYTMLGLPHKKKIPFTIAGLARMDYFDDEQKYLDCKNTVEFFEGSDDYFRSAYHGGLNISNGHTNHAKVDSVTVYDVNSLYPYVMAGGVYPVGSPWKVKEEQLREYIDLIREGRVYMFIRIKTALRLKPNGIPCIALSKKDPDRWKHDRQWLYDSAFVYPDGRRNKRLDRVELTLTQTDYFLLLENYDLYETKFVSAYAFQGKKIFENYVSKWYGLKKMSDSGIRRISKIMENSLAGSMARRTEYINGRVEWDERGVPYIKYIKTTSDNPRTYVHIGAAITSYARRVIINGIKANRDTWLYTDTDSLHLAGSPKGISIGPELGQYKIEHTFDNVYYIGDKQYIYQESGKYRIVMAGLETKDANEIETYINHETGGRDLWTGGKHADEWRSVWKSENIYEDLDGAYIPASFTYKTGIFDYRYKGTWQHIGMDKSTPDGVYIKTHSTSIPDERERDRKAVEWWNKTKKKDPLPLDKWLENVTNRADGWKDVEPEDTPYTN